MSVQARAGARAAIAAIAVVVADQLVKAIVRHDIALGERHEVLPFLDLVHVRNSGVAFGALAGGGVLVVVLVTLALGALVAYFATHADRPLMWLPTGLLLGGALGNVIDRIRLGSVTDFVKLPSWPAFNLADMAITVGVVTLLLVMELGEREARRRAAGSPSR